MKACSFSFVTNLKTLVMSVMCSIFYLKLRCLGVFTRLPHHHCYGWNSAFTQLTSICLIQSIGHTRKSRDLKRKAHNFHGNQEYILLVNGAQVCVLSYFRQFPTRVIARHLQKQNQSPTTNWPLTTGQLGPKKKNTTTHGIAFQFHIPVPTNWDFSFCSFTPES